jgi:hypothetical protein
MQNHRQLFMPLIGAEENSQRPVLPNAQNPKGKLGGYQADTSCTFFLRLYLASFRGAFAHPNIGSKNDHPTIQHKTGRSLFTLWFSFTNPADPQ